MEIDKLLSWINKNSKGKDVFVAGGAVRDWLLNRPVTDIDLVMDSDALELARQFANHHKLTFVPLDEDNQVARVVSENFQFDFSSFRNGAKDIKGDLEKRDFTINAMALLLEPLMKLLISNEKGIIAKDFDKLLIDPFGGKADVKKGIIRPINEENLEKDPVRMLRAFRFAATHNFSISKEVIEFTNKKGSLLWKSAPERIDSELEFIMASPNASQVLKALYDSGLLAVIIPEIEVMDGVEQPGFHHLDVLGHLFETVKSLDLIIKNPQEKFNNSEFILSWLKDNKSKIPWLKWAGLLHDFGKPFKKALREDGRVTFYEHDKEGARLCESIGRKLRWSNKKKAFVSNLVRLHMRPFHLLNDLRNSGPSKRAMRRLLEHAGQDFPALFLLSMADSMAGCGPMKPDDLDDQLALLFDKICNFYQKNLKPAKKSPPLLRGTDVMKIFNIPPGPIVGRALEAVKAARIEGEISTTDDAKRWLLEHKDEIFDSKQVSQG